MNKTLIIALHEYKRHVFRKRFLIGLFSVPLVVVVAIGLIFLIVAMESNWKPVGYVDYSGIMENPAPPPAVTKPDHQIVMKSYVNQNLAMAALETGEIQAFYTIPKDFLANGNLSVTHIDKLSETAKSQFHDFLAVNLLRGMSDQYSQRLLEGSDVIIESVDGTRQVSQNNIFSFFIPIFSGIAFITAMFTAGGYLMQAVVEEKENRTMEVLITSISPNQFMTGKILGDLSIGITQILAWLGFILVGILIARSSLDFMGDIRIAPQTLVLLLFILFPGFIMVSAMMAAIGATVTEAREGQQFMSLLSLPLWLPYMLVGMLAVSPNSPLAVGLSLFPFTAPMTMLLRDGMTVIPAWQIAASSIILVISSLACVWLAGRTFRLGMLRYGKRLRFREVFTRHGGVR